MNGEEVKVMGLWGSPFSKRVEMVLKLKGIPYEYVEEDVYNSKSPLLLKYNPIHKKVPVLLHNAKPIVESLVIVEYIDEVWKQNHPILPDDPYDRAMARFWAKFVDEKALVAFWKAFWSARSGSGSESESEREKAVEEARESLALLEKELGEKAFFGGEKIGLVDIAASFIAFWLRIIQEATGVVILTPEKFPKLQRWSEDVVGHSVIKEVLPSKERLLSFFMAQPPIPMPFK